MADIGNAAERLAPNPDSGAVIKFTFTSADSGVQDLTFHDPPADAAGFQAIKSGGLYVCIKTTAAVHLMFGMNARLVAFGAITNANAPLFEVSDGIQDFLLMPGWDSFRCKGDVGAGDLYIWPAGR